MNVKEKLNEAFKLLKEVVDYTGVNLIDNYGYREFTVNEILRGRLPSIKKVIGRTGDDANAINEGYEKIEEKSGTGRGKTLTISSFPNMEFDKQGDPARRSDIYKYDGLVTSFFEYYNPYPTAILFVNKDHVKKVHPLLKKKQEEKLLQFEEKQKAGKKIGRDSIQLKLEEVLQYVKEEEMECWLYGQPIDSKEFFRKLYNNEIKINQ